MSRVSVQNERASPDPDELAQSCRQAVELLEGALQSPPNELGEEVDEAERAVIRLRDGLIERLRHAPSSAEATRLRAPLNDVNASLSLLVGVEYPSAGIQRRLLEQARDTLKSVLAEMRQAWSVFEG